MTTPEQVAWGFRRVRYNTHRAFFALLEMAEIAYAFDRIWRICEARTDATHPALVLGHDAAHWAEQMGDPAALSRLLPALADVLDAEAAADEGRGRTLLGRRLREAARLVREAASV